MNALLAQLKIVLQGILIYLQGMKPTPVPNTSLFTTFLSAIRTYEGANPANNNPYDFRYYPGGYLPKYGVVKESAGGFAMFETLALGELYGETCIKEMIQNHPTWTFLDFFSRYAPSSDNNNPTAYSDFVAKACGVPPTSVLSTLFV
jgi:hypothetical protein